MLGDVVARVVAGVSDGKHTVAARERTDAGINRGRARQHEQNEDKKKAQRGRHIGSLSSNWKLIWFLCFLVCGCVLMNMIGGRKKGKLWELMRSALLCM